jgi:hypothetical protein
MQLVLNSLINTIFKVLFGQNFQSLQLQWNLLADSIIEQQQRVLNSDLDIEGEITVACTLYRVKIRIIPAAAITKVVRYFSY